MKFLCETSKKSSSRETNSFQNQKRMFSLRGTIVFQMSWVLLFHCLLCQASTRDYTFMIRETNYTRLCSSKRILTVNGQFPGPTLTVHKGDTVFVRVHNRASENITIHWHGVAQPRNPWGDGPEYITQCAIQPGGSYRYRVIFSTEEGTLLWHAHSSWARATIHGAIVVLPRIGTNYPFPQPYAEQTIVLGQWWRANVTEVIQQALQTGGDPNNSDAFTINGQPGDLYPCSSQDTFFLNVESARTYLLRVVNAAMDHILFFAIANHNLTVVGVDGSYTKPLSSQFVVISPGQTLDALLQTNQTADRYYIAARAYASGTGVPYDNTTATAILRYTENCNPTRNTSLPNLPFYNDTASAFGFLTQLRSLADQNHPVDVPQNITTQLVSTVSVNLFPCPNGTCQGPNGSRFAASMNNISFVDPSIDILQAYYRRIGGVYGTRFPAVPPFVFNYTAPILPLELELSQNGTEVRMINFNSTVEVVFQGTNVVSGTDHPIHLHGYSFYIVGFGYGNWNQTTDPPNYNLVDPPFRNTVSVPINGWVAIRFRANNPGVWFVHCHIERHTSWGMRTVFIVRNGRRRSEKILPPPSDLPPC